MRELAEIPLPPHAAEVRMPEGFTVMLSPQYARTLVAVNDVLGIERIERRRDLRGAR